MKVVKLHEWAPNQFLSPTLNPIIAAKSQKMTPTLSQNQMPELKET